MAPTRPRGNREGVDADRRRAEAAVETELVPPISIAMAYAGLGDATQGIAWLNRGIDERDIYIPENFFDPLIDPLRRDPQFAHVLTRMGIGRPTRDSSSTNQKR